MKQYGKFKVGDKVRILPQATLVGVEKEEIGKIGVIKFMRYNVSANYGFTVQMKGFCVVRGYIPAWSVGNEMIELAPRKNEQLLFNFMSEE
jgi:hypothetical protein